MDQAATDSLYKLTRTAIIQLRYMREVRPALKGMQRGWKLLKYTANKVQRTELYPYSHGNEQKQGVEGPHWRFIPVHLGPTLIEYA